MARLNEPPVLGDPLEALKRRFIRQNREIARANSIQSTKIRSLECETSRLLSENITLREENIKLQKALKDAQSQACAPNVVSIKDKLEAKVHEIQDLLAGLTLDRNMGQSPSPRQERRKSARQSLYQRYRPTAAELAEIAVAEGRLPPIQEAKTSPTRPLNDNGLHISIPDWSNITDSPELGPPPVAHFEQCDPVKRSETVKRSSEESSSGDDLSNRNSARGTNFLTSNLETRRRHRDGTPSKEASEERPNETDRNSRNSASIGGQDLPSKVGAKRKLSNRDGETTSLLKSMSQQDLAASKRRDAEEAAARPLPRSKSHLSLPSAATSRAKIQANATARPHGRRALGEKSVNTDPVISPAKTRHNVTEKIPDAKKPESPIANVRTTTKEKSTIRQIRPLKPPIEPAASVVETKPVQPKTPAADLDDVFSPESSRPSEERTESRDTPPPTDLLASSMEPSGRPSRRQRSTVSYAEPNLRDKMRRPGKEMVDAVSGIQRSRLSQSDLGIQTDRRASSAGIISHDSGLIPGSDDLHLQQWSSRLSHAKEPVSPLTSRSKAAVSTVFNKPESKADDSATVSAAPSRRRSTAPRHRTVLETDSPPSKERATGSRQVSASQETIAALISSSQGKGARAGSNPLGLAPSSSEMSSLAESLSVFDLHLSSPPAVQDDSEAGHSESTTVNRARPTRSTKRHSSVTEVHARGLAQEREHEVLGKRSANGEMKSSESQTDEISLRRAERAERRRSMMV